MSIHFKLPVLKRALITTMATHCRLLHVSLDQLTMLLKYVNESSDCE